MPSQGGFLTESNVVNLVPLVMAIKKGNEQTAVQRLAAPGIDPNATCGISFNNRGFSHDIVSPVSAIGKFNRMEILEQLVSHPKFDMQSIHEAIRVARINGNHELARELSTRLPVNSFDANGNTMLLHAINDGAVEDVKQLLERGADPDLAGTLGKPLLHAINCIQFTDFSMRGEPSATHVAIVRLLLDKNVNTAIKDDWDSPLQAAGKTVCPQVFAWLSETAKFEPVMHQGFDKVTRCGVIIEYPWYVDILHHSYRYAIQGDRMRQDDWLALMTYLAQHYPEVNFDISERAAGSTLLQKVMEDLIFASQLECNSAGLRFDAGMFGTSMPNDDIKEQTRMSKQSSFMLQLDILLFLFKQPSVNPLTGKNHETGDTLLHDFINKSTLAHLPGVVARVLDLWLRRGFSLDVTNMQGHTLLHTAVLANNLVALEFLLQCGANVNACDKEGNTPLHCTKSAEAIKLLLAYNADTTLRNQQMETPNEKILKKKAGLVLKRNIFQTSRRPYDTFDKAIILTDRMSALLTTEPRVTIKSHEVVLRKVEALKRYKETAIFRPAEVECAAYAQHPALKLYCDYKTGQIMQKPVYVKGRAYNLSTVEACFAERIVKDPITGAEFDITDVIPAYDLQAHMHTAVGIIARSEGESRSAREAIENHQASVKRYI